MGNSSSKDSDFQASLDRTKKIEAINRQAFKADQAKVKLLLLGAGESGKSTLFKQMEIIYGSGMKDDERQALVSVVHSNILVNVRALVNATKKIDALADESLADEFAKVPEAEETVLDGAIASVVKRIWADAGAQKTWAQRSKFQVQDSLSWYMENLDRISAPGYIPSVDDILRARVRTSGIVEKVYKIDKVEFCMYDVGGQRNERKKWIHLFDNVTAVIFVAAISEYDQVLYEDENMYRMDEALLLFDEVCNMKHFRDTSMILFLNKTDLFRQKLKTVPVRVTDGPAPRYKEFAGPYVKPGGADMVDGNPAFEDCYNAAADFFLQLFLRRKENAAKEVYSHFTCATDTNNIKVVFNVCKDVILKAHLRGSGFMD